MTTNTNAAEVNVADILSAVDIEAIDTAIAAAQLEEAKNPPPVEAKEEQKPARKQRKQAEAKAAAEVTHEPVFVAGDLKEQISALKPKVIETKVKAIDEAFDERAAFEAAKNASNDKMQSNLKSYRKRLATVASAGVLCAINVDPGFINREVSSGSRFNVYAIDKVNDLVSALAGGPLQNAVNKAITKSLFAFRKAGVPFNGIAANAAVSDKIKVDRQLASILIRHTASAATAPTQASSTMSALQVLGVVINRGSIKHPLWELTDTPQTRRLEQVAA